MFVQPIKLMILIHLIDNNQEEDKLFVIIQHLSPEQLMITKSIFHSIYLNNWDFCYVDAVGVSVSTNEEKSKLIEKEADIRSWMAHAFGLNNEISPDSVKQAFKSIFFELIEKYSKKCNVTITNANSIPNSKEFYIQKKT